MASGDPADLPFAHLQFPPHPAHQSLMNNGRPRLTLCVVEISVAIMETIDFDQLYRAYKQAVDQWVNAIRAEEALAKGDHSMTQMEVWDDAAFALHDAELTAKKARDAYKNALRKKNYGF
jgi:hypothetical protein